VIGCRQGAGQGVVDTAGRSGFEEDFHRFLKPAVEQVRVSSKGTQPRLANPGVSGK